MSITPSQLEAFPHTRALFEHEKIQAFVQAHTSFNGEQFEGVMQDLKKHVEACVPLYTEGEDTHDPLEALQKGSAKCHNRAMVLYAAAAQLPLLTTCLLVTSGHVHNAAYNAHSGQAVITENRRINIGSERRGSIHNYFISPDDYEGVSLRNYEVARFLRSIGSDEQDARVHMHYWNDRNSTTYSLLERPENRLTHILSVRVGFAAVRFIERSFARAEETKKAVVTYEA